MDFIQDTSGQLEQENTENDDALSAMAANSAVAMTSVAEPLASDDTESTPPLSPAPTPMQPRENPLYDWRYNPSLPVSSSAPESVKKTDAFSGHSAEDVEMAFSTLPDEMQYSVLVEQMDFKGASAVRNKMANAQMLQSLAHMDFNDVPQVNEYLTQITGTSPGLEVLENASVEARRDHVLAAATAHFGNSTSKDLEAFRAGKYGAGTVLSGSIMQRMLDDTKGGTLTHMKNYSLDFMGGINQATISSLSGLGRFGTWALNGVGADIDAQGWYDTINAWQEEQNALAGSVFTPHQYSGTWVGEGMSMLSSGLGSTVPYIAVGGGLGAIAGAVGASAGTAAALSTAGTAVLSYGQMNDAIYQNLKNAKMADEMAMGYASLGAVPAAGVEVLGFGRILGGWRNAAANAAATKGLDRASRAALGKIAQQQAANAAVRSPAWRALREFAGDIGAEAGGEFASSLIVDTFSAAASGVEGLTPELTFDQFLGFLPNAAKEGIIGGLAGGVLSGGRFAARVPLIAGQEVAFRTNTRKFDTIVDSLAGVPELKTNPTLMGERVAKAWADANLPDTVYVNPQAFERHFNGDIAAQTRAMADTGINTSDLEAAKVTGADLAMPGARLAEHIARVQTDAGLKGLVKFEPDGPVIDVARSRDAADKRVLTELTAIREANEALPEAFRRLRDRFAANGLDIRSATDAARVVYAQSKVFGNLSGMTPEEYIAAHPITSILQNSPNLPNTGTTAEIENSILTPDNAREMARTLNIPEQDVDRFVSFVERSGAEMFVGDVQSIVNASRILATASSDAAANLQALLDANEQLPQGVLDWLKADNAEMAIEEIAARVADLLARSEGYLTLEDANLRRDADVMAQAWRDAGNRGDSVNIPGMDANIIRLFAGRFDSTTLLHELSHIFLNQFITQAMAEGAPDYLLNDLETLNKTAGGGLFDPTGSTSRLAAEERVAEMMETYFSEGKAPSPELVSSFGRFRRWMADVYRFVRNLGSTRINDKVRAVFDRMLASEEQIAQAAEYYNLADALEIPADITGERRERLEALRREAVNDAGDARFAELTERANDADAVAEAAREVAETVVGASKPYRMAAYLEAAGGVQSETVQLYTSEATSTRITDAHRLVSESGMDLDAFEAFAASWGYTDPAKLLTDLETLPTRQTALDSVASELAIEMTAAANATRDGGKVTPADAEYHNDAMTAAMAAKMTLLDGLAAEAATMKGTEPPRFLSEVAMRAFAEERVNNGAVRNAANINGHARAMQAAVRASAEAERAGSYEAAATEYRKALLNHYIIKQALDTRGEIFQFKADYTTDRAWRERFGGDKPVTTPFTEFIRRTTTMFGLTKSAYMRPAGDIDTVPAPDSSYLADNGVSSVVRPLREYLPAWIIDGRGRTGSWMDLTVNEMREMKAALDNMVAVGRGETIQGLPSQYSTIDAIVSDAVKIMDSLPAVKNNSRLAKWFRQGKYYGMATTGIMDIADGNPALQGKDFGVNRMIVDILTQAAKKRDVAINDFSDGQKANMAVIGRELRRLDSADLSSLGRVPPGLSKSLPSMVWTSDVALAMAIESASEHGRAKLRSAGVTETQMDAALALLSPEVVPSLNAFLNSLNQVMNESRAATAYNKGYAFSPVEVGAHSFTASDGSRQTLRVGLLPTVTDKPVAKPSGVVTGRAAEGDNLMASVQGVEPNADAPGKISLSMNHLYAAVSSGYHNIFMSGTSETVMRILTDENYQAAFSRRMGREAYKNILEWAQREINPNYEALLSQGDEFIGFMASKARAITAVGTMGLSPTTAFKQTYDVVPIANLMRRASRTNSGGMADIVLAAKDLASGSVKLADLTKKSDVLRLADNSNTTKLRVLAERAQFTGTGEKGFLGIKVPDAFLNTLAFGPMAMTDLYARATVFQAAYSQAMRGDANFDPATVADLEAKAIDYADKMASEFSGVTTAEMSNFQATRSVWMRMINMYLTGQTMRFSRFYKYVDTARNNGGTAAEWAKAANSILADSAYPQLASNVAWLAFYVAMGINDKEDTLFNALADPIFDVAVTPFSAMPGLNYATSSLKMQMMTRGPGAVAVGDFTSPAAPRTAAGYAYNVFIKAPHQVYKGNFKPKILLDALPLFGIPGRAPAHQAIRAYEAFTE